MTDRALEAILKTLTFTLHEIGGSPGDFEQRWAWYNLVLKGSYHLPGGE